jgi:phosphoribosylanthranilate isomerase
MMTQIYEVSNESEVALCVDAGINHIGILVGDGSFPRELMPIEAHKLFDSMPDGVIGSALSLSADRALIETIIEVVSPHLLHLGAAPEALGLEVVRDIKAAHPTIGLMRSIPVVDKSAIDLARAYDGVADFLLLDSHTPGDKQIGALGITHDWAISRQIVEAVEIPCILAGGLGPDNVAAAIQAVRPAGVDSKTRTDITGQHNKDPDKVRAFVREALAALS